MNRLTFVLLLMSAAILNSSCKPDIQNSNGNANKTSNTNANEVEAFFAVPGDKAVAISVSDDPNYPIQVSPSPAHLRLHPTDPTKHQKIRWCIYNNTDSREIDWVKIEAKTNPGITDPFEDPLPLTPNSDIEPGDSHCTKKYRPKRPPAGSVDYFNYKVTVRFKDGTEIYLDPQVVISDTKTHDNSNANQNGNSNR